MSARLNPYLTFDGQAREAMDFYADVFGGDLTSHTFAEFGAADGEHGGRIMHAQLQTPLGFTLMASDTMPDMPGMTHTVGDNISISVSGDDADALRHYWNRLSEGANVTMPLAKQMWGDEFGMLTDQFGIPWMINIAGAAAQGED